jgi:hypothetical protein
VENKTTVIFYIITLYNLLFHVIKIFLYYFKDNLNPEAFFMNKALWVSIFVLSLAFLVLVTGVRLMSVAAANYNSAY